jgi:hypothetical protein
MNHLRANGFRVKPVDVPDNEPYRRRSGIPDSFGGCHTGIIDGYAIEWHVPAREIKRLIAEKPKAAGLALPGMPTGSPGMEQGPRIDPYDVMLIGKDGRATVYAKYGGR